MFNRMIFVYGAIVFFFGFLLLWIIQYFWKAHNRSALDYHTPLKLRQNVGEEKRKHPRVDINWPVSMETSDGIVVAEVKNISLGGAFICCKEPLPLREVFRLTMIGPDNEPVMATAEVAWSNVNVPEEKVINRGMGVRFINMSDRHIQLVRQICPSSD
jgi:hypothetical protein